MFALSLSDKCRIPSKFLLLLIMQTKLYLNYKKLPPQYGFARMILRFEKIDISLISLNMRNYLLLKHSKISWYLINFYVTCNPNRYPRFWCVPVNNLERFKKKNLFKVFSKFLFNISTLNLGAVDLEYHAKMRRIVK